MFLPLKRSCVAGTTVIALGASLLVAPLANADTPQSAAPKQTTVHLPLACNLQTNATGFIASMVNGVYNSANDRYKAFKLNVNVEAPETVASGEKFDYTILPSPLSFPNAIFGVPIKEVGQMNFWLNLPDNAHFEELVVEGDNKDLFNISVENGRLHITGSEDAADVTQWTATNFDDWTYAGLKATNNKAAGQWEVALPKITVKMTATGAADQTFQPNVGTLDAMDFSPESFLQLRATARDYLGFARCALSEHDSYYPSKGGKNLSADPFPAVEITAAKYATTANIQFLDAKKQPLAEGTKVFIDEGDGNEFTEHAVDSNGKVQLTYKLAQDETKAIKAGFAESYKDAAEVVTVTGTGAESAQEFTVQKPEEVIEKADNYAKVKLVDSKGKPLPAGTVVLVTVDEFTDQLTTTEDGVATIKVRLADAEEKEVTVALADDKNVSVSFKLTGGQFTDPDKGFEAPKALTKKAETPKPGTKPGNGNGKDDEVMSSLGSIQIPQTLGIILAVALGLQSFFFVIKNISDFLNTSPLFAPFRGR